MRRAKDTAPACDSVAGGSHLNDFYIGREIRHQMVMELWLERGQHGQRNLWAALDRNDASLVFLSWQQPWYVNVMARHMVVVFVEIFSVFEITTGILSLE